MMANNVAFYLFALGRAMVVPGFFARVLIRRLGFVCVLLWCRERLGRAGARQSMRGLRAKRRRCQKRQANRVLLGLNFWIPILKFSSKEV